MKFITINLHSKKILIPLLIVCTMMFAAAIYAVYHPEDSGQLTLETNAITGVMPGVDIEKRRAELQQQLDASMIAFSINSNPVFSSKTAEGNLFIENPGHNNKLILAEIHLADNDQIVYTSNALKPGTYLEKVTLDQSLPKGQYDAIAYIIAYDNVTLAILSVTLPSNILFDIGLGVEGDNKVISPHISFTNNSNAPVSVYVTDLQTDLSGLGTSNASVIQYIPSVHGGSVYVTTSPALEDPGWSEPYVIYLEGSPQYPFATPSAIILSGGAITAGTIVSTESNEITLGLKAASSAPTELWDTKWLVEGVDVPMKVADIPAIGSSQFYVVGTLGAAVPENRSFIVRPTFIAQYQL